MKLTLFSFLCAVIFIKAEKFVKISVYYETLCPDSIAFVTDQLYENYETFGEQIQLELIPYGHAEEINSNGNKTFSCQHGPEECFGNLIHGIVVYTQPIAVSVKFVYCSESADEPTSQETLKKCAEQCGISWQNIEKIQLSGKGADIMSNNGKKTNELKPVFIPTIVFNDAFNEEDQDQAINDLKSVICEYLEYKPNQCNSLNNVYVKQI